MAEEITLELISRQLDRVFVEIGSLRDDMTVMTGIMIRLEGAMEGLAVEVRGMRAKLDRLDHRVRKLEDTSKA